MSKVDRRPARAALPERVLVKEVNWLGDVVMSLPAVHAVRRAFPEAGLSVLVKRELASFFAGLRWVDEVIPYAVARGPRGLADRAGIVSALRRRRFDLAILFPKSFQAALWAALAGIPRRVGFRTQGRGILLTDGATLGADLRELHHSEIYRRLLERTLGIDARGAGPSLEADPQAVVRMRGWLAARRLRPSRKLVAMAPGAAYGPAKEWPFERYAALVDLLEREHGAECVFVGAPSERARCERVAAAARERALVAAGETTVGELIALLSLSGGFAGNDSGAMHVAGALGIPTIGIFGSTDPRSTRPLGPRTRVVYHQIECSPCFDRTCRFGHYECLKRISPEEVARALVELGALG